MSRRGKRGVASCSSKSKESDFTLEFNKNLQPAGDNHVKFSSWLGLKLRVDFPYHIATRSFKRKKWDDLWLEIKETWSIRNDEPKSFVLKKAKRNCTNWRSFLVSNYVNHGKTPFDDYKYLNKENWNDFVMEKTSKSFLEKSAKAKKSARANKNHSHLGRTGYAGLMPKADARWSQLLVSYPYLEIIQCERSRLLIMAKSVKNPHTNLYEIKESWLECVDSLIRLEKEMIEDGSFYGGREDPITRLFGPEHGGRSRTVSNVIGSTKVHGGLFKVDRKHNQNNVPTNQTRFDFGVDVSPVFYGPDIENICKCDLLTPYKCSLNITVAKGLVYPTSNRTLNGTPIKEGYVKVQVDTIEVDYEKLLLPQEICTDEFHYLGDTRTQFLQWPRYAIKILDTNATHKTTGISSKAMSNDPPRQSSKAMSNDPPRQPQPLPPIATQSCYVPKFAQSDRHEQYESQDEQHIKANYSQMSDDRMMDVFEDVTQLFVSQASVSKSKPKPNEKPDEKLIEAWNKIKFERPSHIQKMAEQLTKLYGDNIYIVIPSPLGMYPEIVNEYVQYEGVLPLFANEWVDNNFIHWCEMYLYEMANMRSSPTQCAYLNPAFITGRECINNTNFVQAHIIDVYKHHLDNKYFLAPLLHKEHWSLFIFSPSEAKGYIIDSLMGKNKSNDYPLSNVIEESFGFKFKWKMVECKQQGNGWACGYMVIMHMFEFVVLRQFNFPENIWNDTSYVTQEEIDKFLAYLMPQFFSRVFDKV